MKKLSAQQKEILVKCFGLALIAISALYFIEYLILVK